MTLNFKNSSSDALSQAHLQGTQKEKIPEQQNTGYKKSCHDDYVKWVSGFALAQGGVIFIGKDDIGNKVGISDCKNHSKI